MMRGFWVAGLMCSGVASLALAEGEKRELGAHEHGHSALNVAIEGDRIEMELVAPGADIVGFEHIASTAEDMAAVEQAEETLGEPLSLFRFADAAGCVVETALVEIEGEEHGDDAHAEDEHHHEEHAEEEHHEKGGEHAGHDDHEDGAAHNEFHAEYALTCSAPDALDGIDFAAFFEAFEGAEEVEVTVISEKGQTSYEVERDAPTVDLQGMM